jgi:glycosyltransferase involved in cell wall biosynthesis
MKIALVHDFLIKLGGAEKVLQVLHKIYPDAPVYTLLYDREGTKGIFEKDNYKIITSSLQNKPSFIRKRPKLLLNKFPQAIEEFNFSDFDLVISDSNSFAHGIITGPETVHICYCYSPTRYLWDWHNEYLAENHIGFGLISRLIRARLSDIRIWDRLSAERVNFWISQSKTVGDRVKKYYRKDSIIINPPVDIKKFRPSGKPPKDYYLIVSRLSPYKKIDIAIEAFNRLNKRLIIAGEGSDKNRLEILADSKQIEFLGYISDIKYQELLQDCKAFVFPGEEDFGLTPIEAMASGRPVIAYSKGGVTETVVDGETGIFFNQPIAESLIAAIKKFEKNINQFKTDTCRSRAEQFSEEIFINKIENVINTQIAHTNNHK